MLEPVQKNLVVCSWRNNLCWFNFCPSLMNPSWCAVVMPFRWYRTVSFAIVSTSQYPPIPHVSLRSQQPTDNDRTASSALRITSDYTHYAVTHARITDRRLSFGRGKRWLESLTEHKTFFSSRMPVKFQGKYPISLHNQKKTALHLRTATITTAL